MNPGSPQNLPSYIFFPGFPELISSISLLPSNLLKGPISGSDLLSNTLLNVLLPPVMPARSEKTPVESQATTSYPRMSEYNLFDFSMFETPIMAPYDPPETLPAFKNQLFPSTIWKIFP